MSNAAYPDKQFTDSEKFDICRSYKNAIDQSTMVTTLSELYACSPHSIEAVLVEARQLPQLSKSSEKRISTLSEKRKSKTSIGRRMHWSPDSIAKLQEYCSLNMSISDIADKFEISRSCAQNAIYRFIKKPKPANEPTVDRSKDDSQSIVKSCDTGDAASDTDDVTEYQQPLTNDLISQLLENISTVQELIRVYTNIPYDGTLQCAHQQGMIVGEIKIMIDAVERQLKGLVN